MPRTALRVQGHLSITQTGLMLSLKAAAVVTSTVCVFFRDLILIFTDALQNEMTSYIFVIPFIFTYLVYRKRKMLRTVISPNVEPQSKNIRYLGPAAGMTLAATAMLLYWYGSQTFTPLEYHMFVLPLFTAGLCLILFSCETLKQLAFPIAFLFFLVPPPSEALYAAGSSLQILSAEASNAIANLFHIPSMLTAEYGNPLITITRADGSTIPFSVDIACSGIYSLIGSVVFAAFVAYITRDRLWKKTAIIMVGIPIIYLFNIIRITAMLVIGYHYGSELALQIFHLLGGWILIFLGTLSLLLISEKVFKAQIFAKQEEKCVRCHPTFELNSRFCTSCGRILRHSVAKAHVGDLGKIFTVMLVASLLAMVEVPVFATMQGPPVTLIGPSSGEGMSTQILPQSDNYTLSFLYRDTEFEALSKQDMSIAYAYSPINGSYKAIWVALEIASTPSPLHRWEVCLITWRLEHGYGTKATQIELRDIQLRQNPPVVSRYFVFNYTETNETQAVLYWFETATFTANSTSQEKHVKISLIAYPENMDELQQIEDQLVNLARAITDYWHPVKTWSQITILISQNGITLSAATVTALAMIIVYYGVEARKRRAECLSAGEKLAKTNREIVDAIRRIKEPTMLENIAKTLREITGQEITNEQLQHRIDELEKTGIIRSAIYNQNDEPIQTWKI